jgi:hypothetical protein
MRIALTLATILLSSCGNSSHGETEKAQPELTGEKVYSEWTPDRGVLSGLAAQGELTRFALIEELYRRTVNADGRPANLDVIADVLDSKLTVECNQICRISEKERP